jgi:S-formylglutathione hydrolase FrmB
LTEPRPVRDSGGESSVEIRDLQYYSRSLSREQPYLCLLPTEADAAARRYPLLLLLHGFGGNYRDWVTYTRIRRCLEGQQMIVVCPDGGNGWYTNSADGRERREDDLILDLLPHLERTLPIHNTRKRAIAGLSMGGYGAVKLALKHPDLFACAASHSGAMDIMARWDVHPVFGDVEADAEFRRRENVSWLAEQALCGPPTERPRLFLDCGLNDPLLEANRRFSDHLNFIGYGHTYRELPGHHTWPYWDRAFRTVLPEIVRIVG